MISYLKGEIIDKDKRSIILDVHNVGYRVFIADEILAEVGLGEKKEFFIYTSVKEDDISLYGFKNKKRLFFFKLLISVNGVGPRTAMEIMGAPQNIVSKAIIEGDSGLLTKVKGLGKKTAERIILELKNKLDNGEYFEKNRKEKINEDAVSALITLGYERYIIMKELNGLPEKITRTEEIVKWFLKKA